MNRRDFLTAGAAAVLGGRATALEALTRHGITGGLPRAEPAICLNVHPAYCAMALPLVQRARVRHIRATWWSWSRPEEWSWYPAYRAAGIEVLPLLDGGPEWKGIERYDALRRHAGPFPWIQLENEPDDETASAASGARVGRYLKQVADHIRRRDPGTKICAPGLGWTQPAVMDFLGGMLRSAPGAFDALSIHIYGHHPYGEPLSRWRHVRQLWNGPIWSTELGQGDLSTRAYHQFRSLSRQEYDEFQARAWRISLSEDEGRLGYERIYGFHLGWDEGGFGILNADGSPRRAYEWLVDRS